MLAILSPLPSFLANASFARRYSIEVRDGSNSTLISAVAPTFSSTGAITERIEYVQYNPPSHVPQLYDVVETRYGGSAFWYRGVVATVSDPPNTLTCYSFDGNVETDVPIDKQIIRFIPQKEPFSWMVGRTLATGYVVSVCDRIAQVGKNTNDTKSVCAESVAKQLYEKVLANATRDNRVNIFKYPGEEQSADEQSADEQSSVSSADDVDTTFDIDGADSSSEESDFEEESPPKRRRVKQENKKPTPAKKGIPAKRKAVKKEPTGEAKTTPRKKKPTHKVSGEVR